MTGNPFSRPRSRNVSYERAKIPGTDSDWQIVEVTRRPLCTVASEGEANALIHRLELADLRLATMHSLEPTANRAPRWHAAAYPPASGTSVTNTPDPARQALHERKRGG